MEKAAISSLLAPYLEGVAPAEAQLEQVSRYLDLLLKWNRRVNLTSVRQPEEIIRRHFGESLFAAHRLLSPEDKLTAFDFGSGAGFPGLPLKIYAPRLRLTLIESQRKKATFLREVIRALGLGEVEVHARRAEELASQAELVTMRAVEKYERALPVAAKLVARQGRLALMIGADQARMARASLSEFAWQQQAPIPRSSARILLVGNKAAGIDSRLMADGW